MDNSKKHNIGLISSSMSQANIKPFINFINILEAIDTNLVVIGTCQDKSDFGNHDLSSYNIIKYKKYDDVTTINLLYTHLLNQIKMSYALAKNIRKIDLCIFYLGDVLIFPFIVAKLFGKKTMLVMGGYLEKEVEMNGYPKLILVFKKINLRLSDNIILYSSCLIDKWNLQKHREKIIVAHKHYVNFDLFKISNDFENRHNMIAYIGRFSHEKGIMNFVKSIPRILQYQNDVNIILVGDGPLKDDIQQYLYENNLELKVKLIKWVKHKELPQILNNMKLIIIPSYTEGLSNIVIEAMACGTVVISTSVGAIPDVIHNNETGFLLKDNEPETIAKAIFNTLNYADLGSISKNSNIYVREKFSFKLVKEKYKEIIANY